MNAVDALRACCKCGNEKARADFYPREFSRPSARCKECILADRRTFYAANSEEIRTARRRRYDPVRTRAARMRRVYGITVEEFHRILTEQDGRCAICKTEEPGGHGRFHVDHDHATGEVRGILCHYCNVGLGHFGDDPERLLAAWTYVARSTSEV